MPIRPRLVLHLGRFTVDARLKELFRRTMIEARDIAERELRDYFINILPSRTGYLRSTLRFQLTRHAIPRVRIGVTAPYAIYLGRRITLDFDYLQRASIRIFNRALRIAARRSNTSEADYLKAKKVIDHATRFMA